MAHAELTWNQMGDDAGPARRVGRRLTSSHATSRLVDGGWTKVRHMTPGSNWHPAADHLAGTAVYGDSDDDSAAWSIDFESAVPGYDQFLFASDDGVYWLVATKSAVAGANYENMLRDVMASSSNADAHQVRWYNRPSYAHDPWISLQDHLVTAGNVFMYAGNSKTMAGRVTILENNGGADVYVRVGPTGLTWAGTCDASNTPTNGGVGDCTSSLASGSTCQPTCDPGYAVSGTTSCWLGTLTAATCNCLIGSVPEGSCPCPKDHRVLNGACVACDPGVFRAPGDVPSNGDTECECKCKARTRAWGFTMSD